MGYGFVDFTDHRSAEFAMSSLNGREIYGSEIRINWAVATGHKEDTTAHHHLFVGDLSPEVDDQALWGAFSAFGSLSDARVMKDTTQNRSRGYGFVAFRDTDDAEQAREKMNGVWLGARAIRVNWANQKIEPKPVSTPGKPAPPTVVTKGNSTELDASFSRLLHPTQLVM